MTTLTGPYQVLAVAAVLSMGCLVVRQPRASALLVGAPLLGLLVNEHLLQPAFGRPAATGVGDAYPSGHATAAFALTWTVLALLPPSGAIGCLIPRLVRICAAAAVVLLPVYVTAALLLLRHHYVTDVLGGAAVAGCAVAVLLLLADSSAPTEPGGKPPPARESPGLA
jgi:membrane-associated phospholipid phosphatase